MVNEISDKPLSEELESLFNEKDTSGQVEAIKQLFDLKNIKMKSEVNPKVSESEYFSKLFLLGDMLEIPYLERYCNEVITLRVSNERKGRIEAVNMTRGVKPDETRRGFLGMFR